MCYGWPHMSDPYEILGIHRGAEPEVAEAAYRALMKKYHPDRSANPDHALQAREINAAYETIKRDGGHRVSDSRVAWVSPDVPITPAIPAGQNLTLALLGSIAVIAICAVIATSG